MSSLPVFNIHLRLAFKTLFNFFLQYYYSPPVSLALYQMISVSQLLSITHEIY